MARFELEVSLVSQGEHDEIVSETSSFMCFCKDLSDLSEIQATTNAVVEECIELSEDEVLFGTADVMIDQKTILLMQFQNKNRSEDIEDILDFILEDESPTIH